MTLPASVARHPELDSWVRIDPDETVTLFTGKVELGQGLRTAIARIGAEELDVALERVRVETADTAHGLDEGITAGSGSVEQSGPAMRVAAAEARAHLIELAAAALDTRPAELRVDDGVVIGPGGRTTYWQLLGGGRFGRLITGAAAPKPAADHRLVGKPGPRIDLPELVAGSARFVQDVSLPGMLYGRVVRPPSPAARLEYVDEVELPGATLVRDGGFLGVVAEREEDAAAAAERLRRAARWSEEPTLPPARALADWLRRQPARSFPVVDGAAVDAPVPPLAEPAGAARTLRASYSKSYTMHGSIGPSAAVAEWSGGDLVVRCSAQGIYPLRAALAAALGLEPDAIRVVHVPGPGCYGHNGADDVALDAALLARAVPGRPVRVQWTREDEHAWEPYGPAMLVELQASIDANGALLDWNHDAYGTTHLARPLPSAGPGSALVAAWHLETPLPRIAPVPRLGFHIGIHRNADPLYDVPSRRVVKHLIEAAPLRTSSLRSLGAYANVFAIESFMDELAEAAGADAVEFRLRHLRDERAREVLVAAAERAGWPGEAIGVAFARYENVKAYAAVAVEVAVDDETAEIRLERAWIVADAGEVVDPSGLANQLEGGFVQAASWTLKEQVAFDDTRVTSTDWETYPILTFPEVPEIETVLLDRPGAPFLGAGEASCGPTPAAIANAVRRATGIRLRDIPFTPERVRAAAAL